MGHNVLVLARNPYVLLNVVWCLGEAGHVVHALCSSESVPAARLSRHCARYARFSPAWDAPRPADVAAVERWCRDHDIEIVVPADVEAARFVQRGALSTRVRLTAVPAAGALDVLNDKARFARFCAEHGLPHPHTEVLEDLGRAPAVDWRTPRFIKPAAGSFGAGAARLDSAADLERYAAAWSGRLSPPFVLQELVPGDDIDLSLLASGGTIVAWSIQRMGLDENTRVFLSHPAVLELGRAIVAALGYEGVLHLDMRIDDRTGQVVVFEGNPRYWFSLAFSMWAGVNFADLAVRMAFGEPLGGPHAVREGPCRRPRIRFGELATGLLQELGLGGAIPPPGMAAWRTVVRDPLPVVYEGLKDYLRRAARLVP